MPSLFRRNSTNSNTQQQAQRSPGGQGWGQQQGQSTRSRSASPFFRRRWSNSNNIFTKSNKNLIEETDSGSTASTNNVENQPHSQSSALNDVMDIIGIQKDKNDGKRSRRRARSRSRMRSASPFRSKKKDSNDDDQGHGRGRLTVKTTPEKNQYEEIDKSTGDITPKASNKQSQRRIPQHDGTTKNSTKVNKKHEKESTFTSTSTSTSTSASTPTSKSPFRRSRSLSPFRSRRSKKKQEEKKKTLDKQKSDRYQMPRKPNSTSKLNITNENKNTTSTTIAASKEEKVADVPMEPRDLYPSLQMDTIERPSSRSSHHKSHATRDIPEYYMDTNMNMDRQLVTEKTMERGDREASQEMDTIERPSPRSSQRRHRRRRPKSGDNPQNKNNNDASVHANMSLGPAMSFDSVMVYPPSKLHNQHRDTNYGKNNDEYKGMNIDNAMETLEEDRNDASTETDAVEVQVHGVYYNVLDELRKDFIYSNERKLAHVETKIQPPRNAQPKRRFSHPGISPASPKSDYGPSRNEMEKRSLARLSRHLASKNHLSPSENFHHGLVLEKREERLGSNIKDGGKSNVAIEHGYRSQPPQSLQGSLDNNRGDSETGTGTGLGVHKSQPLSYIEQELFLSNPAKVKRDTRESIDINSYYHSHQQNIIDNHQHDHLSVPLSVVEIPVQPQGQVHSPLQSPLSSFEEQTVTASTGASVDISPFGVDNSHNRKDNQRTTRTNTNNTTTSTVTSTSRSKQRKTKRRPTKKQNFSIMSSTKSKSIRRLFKTTPSDDRDKPKQERRRNFAFMKSPNKKKVSSATLEKARARSKQLAQLAGIGVGSPDYQFGAGYNDNSQSHSQRQGMDMEMMFHANLEPNTPSPVSSLERHLVSERNAHTQSSHMGLNFAALESESVISSMSSVYDMDTFDDQSMLSSASNSNSMSKFRRTSSATKSSKARKNRLDNFNISSSSRRIKQHQQQHQQTGALDLFDTKTSMFHPVNMNQQLGRNMNITNAQMDMMSDAGFSSISNAGVGSLRTNNNTNQHRYSTHRSSSSVVSTGSSVSGAAARRLMRRSMKVAQHSQSPHSGNNNFSSNGSVGTSVTSDADSLYSGFEESGSQEKGHGQNQARRPPTSTSPVLFSPKSQSSSTRQGSASPNSMEGGLTFDAFGLDEHQISDDVDAAIAELAETNPDISMFMSADVDVNSKGFDMGVGTASSQVEFAAFGKVESPGAKSLVQQKRQPQHLESTYFNSGNVDNAPTSWKEPRRGDSYPKQSFHSSESSIQESIVSNSGSDFGRRNTQTLRNVKERMKAKSENGISTFSPPISHRPKYSASVASAVSAALPDIESFDSNDNDESSKPEKDEGTFKADFSQMLRVQSPRSNLLSTKIEEDRRAIEPTDIEKRQTIANTSHRSASSEGSSDESREITHFVPKPSRISQREISSESQKRAMSWASERSSPIIISPLLVPKKTGFRKKQTVSQRRAKAWAGECPGSPDVMHRAPPLKAEKREQEKDKEELLRQSPPPAPVRRPYSRPPKQSYAKQTISQIPSDESHEEESSSFTSEDHEVEEITTKPKTPSHPKHYSNIGHRLPTPPEKVVLRRTGSPVFQLDHEKYKTSAPTVALRKVQQRPPKPVKETTNFLANIKLKKVPTPAPRVEHDKGNAQHQRDGGERDYEIEHDLGQQQHNQETEKHVLDEPSDHDLTSTPSDEFVPSSSPQRASKQEIYRNARQHENKAAQLPSRSYKASSLRERERAAVDLEETYEASLPSPESAHPLAAMLASRQRMSSEASPDVKPKSAASRPAPEPAHPVAALFASRALQEESAKETPPPQPAHPVAALFASRTLQEEPAEEDLNHGSAHPVATLFASRARQEEPAEEGPNPGSAHPVAALLSSRQKAPEEVSSTVTEKEEKPSINNVAALFASRSAMMAGSSKPPKEQEPEEGNGKLLQLFANRSASVAKPTPEVETPQANNSSTAVVDSTPQDSSGKPALKNDPKYTKYFKMLKMGIPLEAVKHAMARDDLDPDVMDGDHNKPAGGTVSGIPLKEDPKYQKYFKMLKMGLPMGAVKNAMERDGEDPTVMDGDHNAPAQGGTEVVVKKSEPLPKDNYRRTRLHWDTVGEVKSTSMWALVDQDPDVEDIEIDENEFAQLFQAEVGQTVAVDPSANKKSNAVKVIDPKRANNGGIVLARLKITYEEMAVAIDSIDDKVMSVEQVQGILEYIPTKEEKQSLRKYMTTSNKDSADAFDDLCECEKFMVAMMTVKHSREKVRALLFKLQFRQCVTDLESDVILVEKSCVELKESVRLRKLLGIVLNIGNRLNTAGPTRKGKAGAFTIGSLLKLNQAKAFDKKTTFLHYIVLIVMRHKENLANFKDDLPSVLKSDKIYWDQIENDLEEVENQLENVRKIALHEVFGKKRSRKNDDDMSQDSMSLEEEVEALRSTRTGIFTLQAIKIVSALRESVEVTRYQFSKVLEYFGAEEKKKMAPHELFEIICVFTKDFDAAKEKVIELEKIKQRESRKKKGIRSQSPGNRSRDSGFSKASTDHGTPEPVEKPQQREKLTLRASSMQPHFNRVVSGKPAVSIVKEDHHTVDTSLITDDTSYNHNERADSRSQTSIESRTNEASIMSREKSSQADHSVPGLSFVTDDTSCNRYERGNTRSQYSGDSRSIEALNSEKTGEMDHSISSEHDEAVDDADTVETQEKAISDDSKDEYDENLIPDEPIHFDARTEKPARTLSEPQRYPTQEEASPFQVVERNMGASDNNSKSMAQPVVENVEETQPYPQSMRQKARTMRQQRLKNAQRYSPTPISTESSPPATFSRRRPPTPEGGRQTRYFPSPSVSEGKRASPPPSSQRERISSRRERIARRQRSNGN